MTTKKSNNTNEVAAAAAARAAELGTTAPAVDWSKTDAPALAAAHRAAVATLTAENETHARHTAALEAARNLHSAAEAQHLATEAPEDWTAADNADREVRRITALVGKAAQKVAAAQAAEQKAAAALSAEIDRQTLAAMLAELQGDALHAETERQAAGIVSAFRALDAAIGDMATRSAALEERRAAAVAMALACGLPVPTWRERLDVEVTAVARETVRGEGEQIAAFFVHDHASGLVRMRTIDLGRVDVEPGAPTPEGGYRVSPTVAVLDLAEERQAQRAHQSRVSDARRRTKQVFEDYQRERFARAERAEQEGRRDERLRIERLSDSAFAPDWFKDTDGLRKSSAKAIEEAGKRARRAVAGEAYPPAIVELFERAEEPLPPNHVRSEMLVEARKKAAEGEATKEGRMLS